MTKKPWLSVLIPTYNGENFLPHALNSILDQDDDEIECIVVDDGSTDETLSILDEYQKKLSLRILRMNKRGNWVSSTNHALTFATGNFICFLHQDDLWLKNRLIDMKKWISRFPEAVLFLHPSYFLDAKGNVIGLWRCPLPNAPQIIKPEVMVKSLLIQNFISIPSPFVKREIAERVNGLDETLWYTADWDFWLKIGACGETIYYPKPLSGFRVHLESQTLVRSSYLQDFRTQLEAVYSKHISTPLISHGKKQRIKKTALFSIEVNIALAGIVHRKKPDYIKLLVLLLMLGPFRAYQYIYVSRIFERVISRVRAIQL